MLRRLSLRCPAPGIVVVVLFVVSDLIPNLDIREVGVILRIDDVGYLSGIFALEIELQGFLVEFLLAYVNPSFLPFALQ